MGDRTTMGGLRWSLAARQRAQPFLQFTLPRLLQAAGFLQTIIAVGQGLVLGTKRGDE